MQGIGKGESHGESIAALPVRPPLLLAPPPKQWNQMGWTSWRNALSDRQTCSMPL